MKNYWLMKSEPDAFSIDDLARMKISPWDGVRNYQARNFMQQMAVGDLILFYHSRCKKVGIAGTAEVVKSAYPDYTSWDSTSPYFDPKSSPESPRWFMVDIEFQEKWPQVLTLAELKQQPELEGFALLRKGNRLSVMPVSESVWLKIEHLRPV
ncbi:EVE domain-containing protein [Marinomonas epiphytica]